MSVFNVLASKEVGTVMFSIGFAMSLKPGCYAQYKHYHDHLWPEIASSMADNEVSMAIFRMGERLIVHATAPTEDGWNRSRNFAKLDEWHELMKLVLKCDSGGSIAVEPLEPAFEFGMFAS